MPAPSHFQRFSGAFVALLLLCAQLAGCGTAGDDSSLPLNTPATPYPSLIPVSDSALAAATVTLDSSATVFGVRESLRIGSPSTADTYAIERVDDLHVADNGDIYLMDGGKREIAVFDKSGQLVRRIGRRGEGPGEFQGGGFLKIAMGSDTLFAMGYKLYAFALDGTPYFTRDAQVVALGGPILSPQQFTSTPRGLAVVFRPPPARPTQTDEISFDTLLVKRFLDSTGKFDQNGLPFRGNESITGPRGESRKRMFGATASIALTDDGHILHTDGGNYAVTVHRHDGSLLRRITAPVEPIPVRPSDIDELLRQAEEMMLTLDDMSPGQVKQLLADVRRGPKADFRPVLGAIVAGAGDTILLHRIDLAADLLEPLRAESIWDMVTITGRKVGQVQLPALREVLAYQNGQLYLIEVNADRVHMLVRYDLIRQDR